MHKILLFLFFFPFLLLSDNPKIYTNLGDKIYDNVDKIYLLKNSDKYNKYIQKIERYKIEVDKTKLLGFNIIKGSELDQQKKYLESLRNLEYTHNYFMKLVQNDFTLALDIQDDLLFLRVVNSGLFDTKNNKRAILKYYEAHKERINPAGVIQSFLDMKPKKKKVYKPRKTKMQLQKEKINRLKKKEIIRKIRKDKEVLKGKDF